MYNDYIILILIIILVLKFLLIENDDSNIITTNLYDYIICMKANTNMKLGMLKPGDWRDLSDDELRSLMASAQISASRQKRAAKAAEKAPYHKNNKNTKKKGR